MFSCNIFSSPVYVRLKCFIKRSQEQLGSILSQNMEPNAIRTTKTCNTERLLIGSFQFIINLFQSYFKQQLYRKILAFSQSIYLPFYSQNKVHRCSKQTPKIFFFYQSKCKEPQIIKLFYIGVVIFPKIKSSQQVMNQQQTLRAAFMRPVFSPRAEMSRYMADIEKNKTSLAINIDKETLALFKNEFQNNDNKVDKTSFVAIGLKILKSWQKDMEFRDSRITKYLLSLFQEIQNKVQDIYITWEHFNNLIIEKALNLKSLQSHDSQAIQQLRNVNWSKGKMKLVTPIHKILCINREKKIAYLCEQSNKIEFMSLTTNQHNYRPLVLERQDLLVEKTLVKRVKNQGSKLVSKQNYKKKVVVSGYSVTFLDMIYVNSEKYNMLITSSSDGIIRGWDIHGTTPVLAKQPENQEQKMVHQFSVQIHCMAWDEINDILYCSANDSKIYLWMVKTDSEKELYDADGHQSMISSMIMMPKLQFLATGDYDGKLILWDTISMNKKYKYEQHNRSIVSMTFHEALILLFTASFDHSICVWNPYIPSLIYKISCNVNVLQVQIIPGTNYLAALDEASNLKIRQISKFNLISNYVVDRPDDTEVNKQAEQDGFMKIQPTCIGISQNPVRFFFGGNSIKCMQFNQNQALNSSQFFPTIIKYNSQKLKMYVVIKNSIFIWDMLTGQLYDILHSQSDNEISAMDLISNSGKFVVGDTQGSVWIRKLQNGIKISKLYKHRQKVAVGFVVTREGGVWNQSVIVASFIDGEITVFGKDDSYGYGLLRTFNIRKHFPNASISALQYEEKRNILIFGTNGGDIVCMDVDKSRMTNHVQTKSLQVVKFFIKNQIPSFLSFGKNSEVFGIYLPPHSKKFKASCNLAVSMGKSDQKVVVAAVCKQSNGCFLGYQNGTICHVLLSDALINNQKSMTRQAKKIDVQWQVAFSDTPKDMLLIVNQTVLVIILYMKNITLISTKDGQILNTLPSYTFSSKPNFYETPLCYYSHSSIHQRPRDRSIDRIKQDRDDLIKQKFHNYGFEKSNKYQFYIPEQRKYFNFQMMNQGEENGQLRVFHDPFHLYENYVNFILGKQKDKDQKNKLRNLNELGKEQNQNHIVWNKQWRIFPEFKKIASQSFNQMIDTQKKASQLIAKPIKKISKNSSLSNLELQKAINAQNNWKKLKDEIQQDESKTKTKQFSLSSFKFPSNLTEKQNSQPQIQDKINSQDDKSRHVKHQSLYGNQSSPFIRLGLALQKINEKDDKAIKYIEMGEKKNIQTLKGLKLPRLKNLSSHQN